MVDFEELVHYRTASNKVFSRQKETQTLGNLFKKTCDKTNGQSKADAHQTSSFFKKLTSSVYLNFQI